MPSNLNNLIRCCYSINDLCNFYDMIYLQNNIIHFENTNKLPSSAVRCCLNDQLLLSYWAGWCVFEWQSLPDVMLCYLLSTSLLWSPFIISVWSSWCVKYNPLLPPAYHIIIINLIIASLSTQSPRPLRSSAVQNTQKQSSPVNIEDCSLCHKGAQ